MPTAPLKSTRTSQYDAAPKTKAPPSLPTRGKGKKEKNTMQTTVGGPSMTDGERLVKAIGRGQFADIPRFCRGMILEIAARNKQISSAVELPAQTLRAMLVECGGEIAVSLAMAGEVVRQAMTLVYSTPVEEQFEIWSEASGGHYAIGNLRAEIELVMQNVEALSRSFVKFLEAAQRDEHGPRDCGGPCWCSGADPQLGISRRGE